jgi:hypothetical protein
MRLHSLRKLGMTDIVILPGKERQGWVLAERKSVLAPPASPLKSRHCDNEVVFAELNHASRPLGINDFSRAVIRLTGERPTASRLNTIKCRLRMCLNHHRQAGTVVPVNVPGSNTYGWVLADRESELRPACSVSAKPGPLDAQIRTAMASGDRPLTANEIAAHVFARLAPSHRIRKTTLRSVRNRVWAFLRNRRRSGNVRPVIVKGEKAQGWQWVTGRGLPCESD